MHNDSLKCQLEVKAILVASINGVVTAVLQVLKRS
jgi:hypothetical protein